MKREHETKPTNPLTYLSAILPLPSSPNQGPNTRAVKRTTSSQFTKLSTPEQPQTWTISEQLSNKIPSTRPHCHEGLD